MPASPPFVAEGDELWQVPANLGLVYRAQRRNSQARTEFEKAYRILEAKIASIPATGDANLRTIGLAQRNAARLSVAMSRIYALNGKRDAERDALEKALELDPDNLQAPLYMRRMAER
jgi:tetratricopeptide (TPR) repeat protein